MTIMNAATYTMTGAGLIAESPVESPPTMTAGDATERATAGWIRIIDNVLVEWGRDAGSLQDDEVTVPSRHAIARAIELAQALRQAGLPAPARVAPDGDGGIVFEYWVGAHGELVGVVEVTEDGGVFVARYRGTKLETREQLT